MKPLSEMQRDLLKHLPDGEDVSIRLLHFELFGQSDEGLSVRRKQQRLGSLISRTNERLEGQQIKPGKLKQTYRLEKTK